MSVSGIHFDSFYDVFLLDFKTVPTVIYFSFLFHFIVVSISGKIYGKGHQSLISPNLNATCNKKKSFITTCLNALYTGVMMQL